MAKSMWDQTAELAKRHEQSGGNWLKLAGDGDKAVLVFLGEPFPREVCFVDGNYQPVDEKLKAQGVKVSLRVAINVALFDTKEVKVLEQGVVFFKDLVRVKEKYGLERWAFEVQRHGAAKDPKTSYSILPEHQLSDEQRRAFAALPLHDLDKLYAGETDEAQGSGQVIDPKEAQELAAQLKALRREAVDRFLEQFGIQRIKDLSISQLEKATAFVEQLQSEMATTSKPAEIDPFAD